MERAANKIVDILLETGEPDQNYDHSFYDALVQELEEAGIGGARHREFDKYQGVYLFVPNVGKFWTVLDDEGMKALALDRDSSVIFQIEYFTYNQGQDLSIANDGGFVEYCKRKLAQAQAHQIAMDAVDATMDQTPIGGETVKGKAKANVLPIAPSIGRSGMGQSPSHFPSRPN